MRTTKLLTLLALLITAATGAWAQSTTHIVKQDNVNTIFSGSGYTLGNTVKAGDVLDFQGTIELEGDASHSLVINKPVNIISSEKNAVIKLHTPAGDRTGNNPGSTFVINADGAGTQVQDIRLENTGMWIFNTSNVTFTGVTFHVEGASVCSGIGHVALRYSDHVTFDGCTVYTKNNGGSSCCVLTGSHDCTFKDTHFETAGSAGNVLYIANPYNTGDKPADYTMNNDNISVLNCTFTAESSGATSNFQILGGLRHRIENCTVNFATSFSCDATASEDGHVIRNNTFTQGLKVPKASTVTGNSIKGNVTINANSATVSSTTVYLGSTITGNSILGKVTFSSNSKNNTFTGNTVISSEAYAVVMATTADANNTVTDNILLAASNAGDAAVNLSNGTGNTISNNLSEAAAGDVTWNFDAATGTLTIGGTGAMADYEQTTGGQTTAPWAFLSALTERIVVGEGVSAIGANAFAGFAGVNSVIANGTMPPSLGSGAFDTNATIAAYVPAGTAAAYQTAWGASVASIADYMSCGADAKAIYDASTKTLTIAGYGAMTDFASAADQPWKTLQADIQTVVIEKSITAVGQNAFANCSALTAARIEGTATTIADGAFTGNATGRKIFVPIAAVGNYASTYASTYAADLYSTGNCGAVGSEESVSWEYSNSTKSLTISGTGAMMDYASTSSRGWHSQAASITSVVVEAGVTSIGNYAFYDCSNLATVTFAAGSNLTSIGNYAFQNCSSASFTSINIPASVTSIGESAFRACSNLSSIEIPASVTSIGNNAFRACSNLSSIEIPASVTSIGNNAFYYCSNLTEVYIFAPSLTTYGSDAFRDTPADLKIYVLADAVDTYKAGWSAYADKIQALPYYALTMKEGTQDADKWTVKAGTDGSFQSLPLEGVKAGTKVKLKYDGDRSMVKGVKAEKKAAVLSESFTTNQGIATYDGTHFTITCITVGDGDGINIRQSNPLTITAKNGETITKVEFHSTYGSAYASQTTVTAGTLNWTTNSATGSIDNVNASTVSMSNSFVDYVQINQITVYYTE